MVPRIYSAIFFASLIGSTLCVIPEGEIQIGPIFGKGGRFFHGGHKHFEAVFEKGGDLKPLLAKKAILGVGVLGAGALAAGGAILAKKHFTNGWGWAGQGYQQGYGNGYPHVHEYKYNNAAPSSSYGVAGWGQQSTGYYQTPSSAVTDNVKFPSSGYAYPTPSSSYGTSAYPSTEYGYPESEWQGSNTYGSGSGSYAGWSR